VRRDVQSISLYRIHFGTTCCFFDGSSWNGLPQQKHVRFSKFLATLGHLCPRSPTEIYETSRPGAAGRRPMFWHTRSKVTTPRGRKNKKKERKKETQTLHSYSSLALRFLFSSISWSGRLLPWLSVLLASRGSVVEQGVQGVFFILLLGRETMVFTAGFSDWAYEARQCTRAVSGRTDGRGGC